MPPIAGSGKKATMNDCLPSLECYVFKYIFNDFITGQPNAFHGPQQQGMTAHMNPAFFQSHSPYRFAPCSPRPTNAGMPGPGSGPYHSPPVSQLGSLTCYLNLVLML